MDNHGFTLPQLQAIHDLLEWMHRCNSESDCTFKLDSIEFYKDSDGIFYTSYYKHGMSGGESIATIEYISIDSSGHKTNLNQKYTSANALESKFEKFEKIVI